MKYEPYKEKAGRLVGKSVILRKIYYFLLELLFLRSWHLCKELKKISRTLPRKASVLDAGSGPGQHTWRMAKMNPGWRIKGVDVISREIEMCNEFFRRARMGNRVSFETADLVELNDKETYDLIISVDVMEHIENDIQVFRNFHSALRTGGILLITTPSDQGGSGVDSRDTLSFIEEHVRDGYGVWEITSKLKSAGFTNLTVVYTYGKPGHLSWLISVKYPAELISMSGLFFLILPFYYLLTLPFVILLNFFDTLIKHKSGTGLLVTAVKET